MTPIISQSLRGENKFFIFRETGLEASFQIIKNKVHTMHNLSPEEMKFIRCNYLKKKVIKKRKGHQYFESKINKQ